MMKLKERMEEDIGEGEKEYVCVCERERESERVREREREDTYNVKQIIYRNRQEKEREVCQEVAI